jgi:exo-beta-1,3-glucanase (GH17 family)
MDDTERISQGVSRQGCRAAVALLLVLGWAVAGLDVRSSSAADATAAPAIDLRVQKWHGPAICYSGYRTGQTPKTETFPSQAQVLEDLKILERHWRLIRVYGSDRHSEDVLEVIRRERLNLKVMLGIWLNGQPGFEGESARQLATGIRLANAYPDVVVAVNVGNEALVFWSDHKASEDQMLAWVREVRAAVRCPVTVADDILYWREPKARLVEAVDFITLHSYPIWGGSDIDKGLSGTVGHFESVRQAHPGKTIVLGELGWATYTVGDKHAPRAGDETKQKRYFDEISAWAQAHGATAFFFEAFDEPWKGAGTEAHWGLFSEGRKAKLALRALFPDLLPSGPTSPSYDAVAPATGGPQ